MSHLSILASALTSCRQRAVTPQQKSLIRGQLGLWKHSPWRPIKAHHMKSNTWGPAMTIYTKWKLLIMTKSSATKLETDHRHCQWVSNSNSHCSDAFCSLLKNAERQLCIICLFQMKSTLKPSRTKKMDMSATRVTGTSPLLCLPQMDSQWRKMTIKHSASNSLTLTLAQMWLFTPLRRAAWIPIPSKSLKTSLWVCTVESYIFKLHVK